MILRFELGCLVFHDAKKKVQLRVINAVHVDDIKHKGEYPQSYPLFCCVSLLLCYVYVARGVFSWNVDPSSISFKRPALACSRMSPDRTTPFTPVVSEHSRTGTNQFVFRHRILSFALYLGFAKEFAEASNV